MTHSKASSYRGDILNLEERWAISNLTIVAFIEVLIAGLLFLAIFQLPYIVTSTSHDAGSLAAIDYWTLHAFSYGKDIIQNVGPLGFISYPDYYAGFLDVPKLLINLFLTGSFIFLLLKSSSRLPASIRVFFLLLAAFFTDRLTMPYLLLLLVSHLLMTTTRLRDVLLATLVLALLALTRGTCFFICLFIVAAAVANGILSGRFAFAVFTAMGFVIYLSLSWRLAGQSFANFPAFVYATASFSSGYNEAMTAFEPRRVQIAGFIVLFGGSLPILWKTLRCICKIYTDVPKIGRQLFLSATEFFILFVAWKHGFVRADAPHVLIFFQYVLVSNPWILFRKESLDGTQGSALKMPLRLLMPLGLVVAITSFVGLSSIYPLTTIFWEKYYKMNRTLPAIGNIQQYYRNLDKELRKSVETMQLPNTRALVGNHSISYFGIFPAAMLYNGLNYVSTPSTISFTAWNAGTMTADAIFFRDDNRAPDYLVFDLKTIDGRLAAQDDSLAQLELLHRYEAVDLEAGNIVLRRIKEKEPLTRKPISEHDYKLGEWIDVPQRSLNPTWVKVRVDEGFLAHIVAFAYKPSQYSIEVLLKNGAKKTYKFIPGMAAVGFLINPLITESRDALTVRSRREYEQYIGDSNPTLSKVIKFRVVGDNRKALCARRATVSFEEIHGLVLGCDNDLAKKIYRIIAHRFDFDAELIGFSTRFPVERVFAFGQEFYQFHAPSLMKVHKPVGVHKLKAFYAMRPGAYEQGGATDGVVILVWLETTSGKAIPIFKRDLDPVRTPSDRNEQLLDVDLPSDDGTLFIDINPKASPAYDQFLIRKLVIQKASN